MPPLRWKIRSPPHERRSARHIVQKGLARILSGYELPKTSDDLRATEMLLKLEQDAASRREAEDLLDIIAEVMPTELWEEVMRRLEG